MQIVQVITRFGIGGAEEVAVNLAVGLARRGHAAGVATVFTPPRPDPVALDQRRRLGEAGVAIIELGGADRRRSALTAPLRLAARLRSQPPDLLHAHTDIPDFVVSLAGRAIPCRLARTIHNTVLWPTHRLLGSVAESGFHDDLVIPVSRGAADAYRALRRRCGLPESTRLAAIPVGIPELPVAARLDRAGLIAEYGADPTRVQFGFAGRFTEQKGFDTLLAALARLPAAVRACCEVHAFGAGPLRDACRQQARAQGLPVRFHPPVAGIARVLAAFDAVVMPSRFEGFGLVAIESLAVGVPVLATRAPGLIEALPPDWPLAVPVGDVEALAGLIARLVEGDLDRERLSADAVRWCRGRFSLEAMVEAHEAAYAAFLDRPNRREAAVVKAA